MIDSAALTLSDEKNEQIHSSPGCCMNLRTIRFGLAAATATLAFLAVPAESHAIFHWFGNCCGGSATPTYGAAPLYSAAAPADPCCAPPQISQTVNYVPQTCYRTQYVNVPVTTYRPVTGRDPCTGCPVTCLRPTTAYVQQARMIPYTTYRAVLSNPCCGAAAPAVTAGYAPAYTGVGYAAGNSCSGCAAGTAATYAPAATPYYGGASASTIISPSNSYIPSNGSSSANGSSAIAPTLAPSAGNGQTFRSEKPIPNIKVEEPADDKSTDSGTTSGTGATLSPRLFQPNDRTTSYPILRARSHRPVSYTEPAPESAKAPERPIDDGGWRPSTR